MLSKILKTYIGYTLNYLNDGSSFCRVTNLLCPAHYLRIIPVKQDGVEELIFYIDKFEIIYKPIQFISYLAQTGIGQISCSIRSGLDMRAEHYYRNDEYIAWIFENNLYLLKYYNQIS